MLHPSLSLRIDMCGLVSILKAGDVGRTLYIAEDRGPKSTINVDKRCSLPFL